MDEQPKKRTRKPVPPKLKARRKAKYEKLHLTVKKVYRKDPPNNYMKYWRVVRYWAKRKYEVTEPDLDMLFFLLDERFFTRTDMDKYANVLSGSFDTQRFNRLLKDGWIRTFRKRTRTSHALYEVSRKGKQMIGSIYKKLNGEEDFSEWPHKNPVFKRAPKGQKKDKNDYTDKTMAMMMKQINKENQERRLKPTWVTPRYYPKE